MDDTKILIEELVKIIGGNNSEDLYSTITMSADILASNEIATGQEDGEVTTENASKFVGALSSTQKTEEFKYLRDKYIIKALENYLETLYPSLTEEQIEQITKLLESN